MPVARSSKNREDRARRALALRDEGLSRREVAKEIGCHPTSVKRWEDRRIQVGDEGLLAAPSTGRPPKLTTEQRKELTRQLKRGIAKHGYASVTTASAAAVIKKLFGVQYSRSHISRLMRKLGWRFQSRMPHALAGDAEAARKWELTHWPVTAQGGWIPPKRTP